jgi:hypothetical protein
MNRLPTYLVGVFVCVQLVYLPLSNLMLVVPREPAPPTPEFLDPYQAEGRVSRFDAVQAPVEAVGDACSRWGELTSQPQGWALFAPRFGPAGAFLTLRVMTTDGTTELRSTFEPADPTHYVRFNLVDYRAYYREMGYAILYSTWTPDAFTINDEAWRKEIAAHVRTFRRSMAAYVCWRLAQAGIGDVREVIVGVRVFPGAAPDGTRPGPVFVPLGLWQLERPDGVRAFDPVTGGYGE